MSGKKSSEVADVLRGAEKARKLTEVTYDDTIYRYADDVKRCKSVLDKIKNSLSETEELSADAKIMFGENAVFQENQAYELIAKIRNSKINSYVADTSDKSLFDLERDLMACDKEAADIRKIIATKPHYCDEEYRRAQNLRSKYDQLAMERKNLSNRVSGASSEAWSVLNQVKSWQSQYNSLQKSLEGMNVSAKNKKAADALKKQMQGDLEDIDVSWAKKFFASDFEKLEKDVKALSKKDDVQVIKTAAGVKGEMDKFKNRLAARIAQWHQEKADAEGVLADVDKILSMELNNPVDYANNLDVIEKKTVYDYLDQYAPAASSHGQCDTLLAKANALLAKEDFVGAKSVFEQARNLAQQAQEMAIALQEKMIKVADLAFTIDDIMYEAGYDVSSERIDGNPNNGFKITCKIGDEMIDFNVECDKNGKPVVDIDHKEGFGGGCGKTWEELAKKFRENGIPLTDVRKNGKSILYGKKSIPGHGTSGTQIRG